MSTTSTPPSLAKDWQAWAETPAMLLSHGDTQKVAAWIWITLATTAIELQRLGIQLAPQVVRR